MPEKRLLPFPGPAKETERKTFMGDTGMFLVKTNDAVQKAAWTFISWLFQPKQQARWCIGTGLLPLTKAAYEYPTYQAVVKDKPWWQKSVDYMSHADPDSWAWYGSLGCKTAVEELLKDIMARKVTEKDLKQALSDLEARMKKEIENATPS